MSSAATIDTFDFLSDVGERKSNPFEDIVKSLDFSVYSTNIDYQMPSKTEFDYVVFTTSNNEVRSRLISQIDNIQMSGNYWSEDSIEGPNDFAVSFSRILVDQLVDNEMEPLRITQSAEEGICFVFQNYSKYLYLEIYNDEELGILIEDYAKRKILKNLEVKNELEILQEISSFINKA